MAEITVIEVSAPTWIETRIGGTITTVAALITAGMIHQFINGDSNGLAMSAIFGGGMGIWQMAPAIINDLWKK